MANDSNRRDFLKQASLVSLSGFGLAQCSSNDESPNEINEDVPGASNIMSYRQLGNTGYKVSDISFGAGGLRNYKVALKAMKMGINYFDTAPDYGSGVSEVELGKAAKAFGREKVIIATKMCYKGSYPNHIYNGTKETYIKAVNDSLKRLQTNYIDFLFVHALGEKDTNSTELYRLKDKEMLAAYKQLKKEGKVKHLAVSCHNYKAGLDGGIDYAIDSGDFDLVMLAYNFKGHKADKKLRDGLAKLAAKANKKGVAFVAMKTLKGAKGLDENKLRGKGTFAQASFKWVLSNPDVSCLVVTMNNLTKINEYIKASGKKFSSADEDVLKKYCLEDKNCQIGCTQCESACDSSVKVSDILRYDMYFTNYGQEKDAMEKYSNLPASMKVSCADDCSASCEKACPYGVSIKDQLKSAHNNLSLV